MGIFGRGRQQPEDEHAEETIHQAQPLLQSPQSVSFETVLGPGTLFRGALHSPGSVRLEGDFVGEIVLDGNALVGEHARITADLTAANVTVAGAVRGNISGQRVQLLRTGRVWGDIEASSISTEDGAFIRGTITMKGGDIPAVFAEMEAALAAPTPPLDLPEEPAAFETDEAIPAPVEEEVVIQEDSEPVAMESAPPDEAAEEVVEEDLEGVEGAVDDAPEEDETLIEDEVE
ncbi:MAG: polymer-forming cytoskeletal protein [Anaerolineae bacterium]|nr:polymer-forming cytoskeletal protein [Anaerolineae bacterium]